MNLPADNNILLSIVNTKLRDCYRTFEELCGEEDVCAEEISARLAESGYFYDHSTNSFK